MSRLVEQHDLRVLVADTVGAGERRALKATVMGRVSLALPDPVVTELQIDVENPWRLGVRPQPDLPGPVRKITQGVVEWPEGSATDNPRMKPTAAEGAQSVGIFTEDGDIQVLVITWLFCECI